MFVVRLFVERQTKTMMATSIEFRLDFMNPRGGILFKRGAPNAYDSSVYILVASIVDNTGRNLFPFFSDTICTWRVPAA